MTTEQQIRNLSAGAPQSMPETPGVPVYNPTPCSIAPTPIPTRQGTPLNFNNLVTSVCGYFAIDVDNSATNAVAVSWRLGFCANEVNADIVTSLYGFKALPVPFTESATFLDGTCEEGAVNANGALTQYINECIFVGGAVVGGTVTAKNSGSTGTSFDSFKNSCISVRSMRISGNFSLDKYDVKPDLCSPCFNSTDDVVIWRGSFPFSESTGIAINIPAGLAAEFEFCVIGIDQRQVEPCAGGSTGY